MSKQATKTNNDSEAFLSKVKLRVDSLPKKNSISVLECFAGEGLIWAKVKQGTEKEISILPIDKLKYNAKLNNLGDSFRHLISLDLKSFDIIDIDAYGVPFDHISHLFKVEYKGVVHVTCIQTGMGILPKKLLKSEGYSEAMIKKCPTLFCKNGIEKLLSYIAKQGVKKIQIYSQGRKNYFWFEIV
jgi:tRNA G26 N,N-dimethylase Trm1